MAEFYHKLAKKAIIPGGVLFLMLSLAAPIRAMVPNDPNYPDQAKTYRQIHAEEAWDISTGSKKVVVAFIDTGFDIWHDDIRENIWVNPHEIEDNNKDDDLNGFVDDINGWNFVENNNSVRPSVFESEDDKEAVRHGTLVGGLIGAKANNNLWGTGMSPNVSIMSLRAIKSSGTGSAQSVVNAVNYAVDNGANIINISFMGEKSDKRIYDALRNAYLHGVTIIVSAGNYDKEKENGDTGSRPIYPACFDVEDGLAENWILTVGSVDENDKLSDFSEYGKCLDVLAPGEYIYSTERYAPQYGYNDQFGGPWFGTSFSAPLVAGTAALIKSIHPEFTPKEIINIILNTADPVDSKNLEVAGFIGSGRLNAGRAVESAFSTPLRRGQGNIWYFKGRELWRFDTKSETVKKVTELPPGNLLAFTSYSIFLRDEVALLVKRNNSYYLDVHSESGDSAGSIIIPTNALFQENISIIFNGTSYYLASYRPNTKNNGIDFRIYNTKTKKIETRSLSEKNVSFGVGEDGEVYYSTLKKGVLSLNGLTSKKNYFLLKDVSKVYDLKISAGTATILASKGSRVVLYKIMLSTGVTSSKIVSKETKRIWKLKIFSFADKIYYLPFSLDKGRFVMYDSGLIDYYTFSLPVLPSSAK